MRSPVSSLVTPLLAAAAFVLSAANQSARPGGSSDPRLAGAYRLPERNGWTFVHLEGPSTRIGFQHGSLLAAEIAEARKVCELELVTDTGRDWAWFRREAESMLWPHIEEQYRRELQGIADGLASRGQQLDLWDVVALNGWLEWEYYTKQYAKSHPGSTSATQGSVPEHCSAFAATGSYTADGRPVLAHNNWTNYMDGVRWTIIFDIAPDSGHRILMDGLPGVITSDDDFGINSAGLMITETTIGGFEGYDPSGIPEFIRARKAMQYASSIDEYAAIMREGNNGGYANDWLVADRKTGEIASLELGLKHVTLQRTRDGYFVGANFPIDTALAREETTFNLADPSLSGCARRVRWVQLMEEYKGRIDAEAARRFLADHHDAYSGQDAPSERTLCGHIEASPRGMGTWQPPYGTAGAAQNKVTDAAMASRMSFQAAAGHACGTGFSAAGHLRAHPEFAWEKEFLRDMPARPWTTFSSAQ